MAVQRFESTHRNFPATLVQALERLAHDQARGFVFVRPDGAERFFPFARLYEEVARRAAHIAARGLHKGDRLAMVVPDGDEFVLSFLGAIFAGVVPVPIYPQLSFRNVDAYHDTVAHIAQASGASMLLTTAATTPYVEPALARVPSLRALFAAEEFRETCGPLPARAIGPDDLAFLQFTSGSTSRPKGVVVRHRNLAANSEAFMVSGLQKDSAIDKGVSWLPLFHDMGLIGFVIGPIFTDIPVVFLPTASFIRSPRLWLETLHRHRGTITYAPNFAYALVTKRLRERDLAGLDLSCVRIAGSGAEPIQAKTMHEFAAKLAPTGFDARALLPSYGMAEATLAVTFVPRGTGVRTDTVHKEALERRIAEPAGPAGAGETREIVNCGRAFPGHEVAIVDDAGQPLDDRRVGQIITRGPSVCEGYYNEPEHTAQSFRDGLPSQSDGTNKPSQSDGTNKWLYTGDLGYTVNGEIFICGRVKDIVIIRGRNYYPQDIEWAVGELSGVRRGNVVAFGVDVDGEEELVVIAEALQSDAEALRESIVQVISAQVGLSVYKVELVPQGTLPRTSSGKPQRSKTKQLFLEGHFQDKLTHSRAADAPAGTEGFVSA